MSRLARGAGRAVKIWREVFAVVVVVVASYWLLYAAYVCPAAMRAFMCWGTIFRAFYYRRRAFSVSVFLLVFFFLVRCYFYNGVR